MRQIEDDLDLRLVVEGQELHPHVLGGEQARRRRASRCRPTIRKSFERQRPLSSGLRDADVEAAHRADLMMAAAARRRRLERPREPQAAARA